MSSAETNEVARRVDELTWALFQRGMPAEKGASVSWLVREYADRAEASVARFTDKGLLTGVQASHNGRSYTRYYVSGSDAIPGGSPVAEPVVVPKVPQCIERETSKHRT